MSDHHASQTRARLLNSRVKSRLLPRYELMGSKGDKVDEKCFVFSVIASRTPSLFSPEGERETKIQQVCQNTPNGRYHAPDFSFKNAKLRVNIITIDILRAARVCIAFTFPKLCECAVLQNSVARESFLPYIFSQRALLTKWRFKGVMNFKENDADHSIYEFYILSSGFYAL